MTVTKDQLRKEMAEKRNSLAATEIIEKSEEIRQRLFNLEEFKSAKCIAFYLSKGSEVNTSEMIREALSIGKEVLVPVTNEEIELMKFTSFGDLAPAKFGIPEPKTKIKPEKEPDAIIVPGLAFDLDLHRLGYGKGYYDKLLKNSSAKRIGICFDVQIVEKIPRHEHDQKLDMIITEKKILKG